MTPVERCLQMNVSARRRLAQADAVNQRAGVFEPILAQSEPRQRRTHQPVEGAFACLAHVALETGGRTPWLEFTRTAMAAGRAPGEPHLDQGVDLTTRAYRRQRFDKRLALDSAEMAQPLDKCLTILNLHGILASDEPSVSKFSQKFRRKGAMSLRTNSRFRWMRQALPSGTIGPQAADIFVAGSRFLKPREEFVPRAASSIMARHMRSLRIGSFTQKKSLSTIAQGSTISLSIC